MATTSVMTPIGTFTIVGAGKTVLASGFTEDVNELTTLVHPYLKAAVEADGDLAPAADAVRAYFDGELAAIDSVDVEQRSGGTFMAQAWEALRQVEPGVTVTYTDLAERAGRPTAIRGAAQACARNSAALLVPCHRIVRTDGSLGGYRWGLDAKRALLAHELAVTKTRS
jgi:methylated-DNA-[protein]-cysteine S-methyltransferase